MISLQNSRDGLDRLREECGIFGVFDNSDAVALTALGMHALQHRGQEAAGILSYDGTHFKTERRIGLVGDHFSDENTINELSGNMAIGHVRYSTTGETALRNIQPMFAELNNGGFGISHNGNLTNALTLRRKMIESGSIFQSTSDSEVILHLVSRSSRRRLIERFIDALSQIEGAYSLIALTNKKLIGARDPLGIRPLVLGKLDGAFILASETCALDIIGADYVRDIENGEIIIITKTGLESLKPFQTQSARPCIFEYIYFARPDSIVGGKTVYEMRKNMGVQLARESAHDADIVVPVPDSGIPAALGFSQESVIPLELSIVRNHYVGRTFIEPTQKIRQLGVKLKHSVIQSQVAGKRVILVDDSIVRGTTCVKIVKILREAGAREVHLRVSSPPIIYPDFYGIDTPDQSNLLAANYDLEDMRRFINCDTLIFLSLKGLYLAMGCEERNVHKPQFTDHCFTGDYPTSLTDRASGVNAEQISLHFPKTDE
ncbi:MAG: amidophosphoribosyltransferase [Alphaproteobacteria bacterium]|nr:amidophosphoribosyltransferase [Alphaproteobacteria bacterium]